MKFTIPNHQHKGDGLIEALQHAGHEYVKLGTPADVLLIDHDIHEMHRQPIDHYKELGAKVLMYPHGANPNLQWDGLYEPYCNVDAFLSPNEGHKAVMKIYGYPKPIHVIGWWLCEQSRYQATPGKNILFAPIHPNGENYLPYPETTANRDMFDQLVEMKTRGLIDSLTVRYLNGLEANGIPLVSGVTYRAGIYDNSYRDVLHADCVVTSGTYGYMTAALGKPLVMYWQGLGTLEKDGHEPAHYELYKDILHYPIDPELNRGSLEELIPMACHYDHGKDWRQLFIGEQLGDNGVKVIEEVVNVRQTDS